MDDEERCPNPDCYRPFHATGQHIDSEDFAWGGKDRENARDRQAATFARLRKDREDAKERAIERALEGMP